MASTDEFHTPNKKSDDDTSHNSAEQTPLTALFSKHSRSVSTRAHPKRGETPTQFAMQELKMQASAFDYADYVHERVSGVYILPDPCDISLWHGSVTIRFGAYKGACFRFHLRLAAEHPAAGAFPTLTFIESVFHPLVEIETGLLQLKDRFPTWSEDSKPAEVAIYAKQIFLFRSDAFETQNALNPAALNIALGHTPPGSPSRSGAQPEAESKDAGATTGVFSSFLKTLGTSVLNSAAESAEAPVRPPAAEEHLMQFAAPVEDIRDVRRFVTSQMRTGPEMLRFLLQGQKASSVPAAHGAQAEAARDE